MVVATARKMTGKTSVQSLEIKQPTRVTVLAGGLSRERPVSLVSGKAVAEALRAGGFAVTMADVSPDDLSALDIPADVIFPVLHGKFGEDGELQAILEKKGIPYCGSGPQACRTAMNKHLSKVAVISAGIPTPAYDVVETPQDVARAQACWSIPVVVKPTEEGSSFGVTIVRKAQELGPTLIQTLQQFGTTMVEEFIDGRELTVGIFGNKALPILEIRSHRQFYDYQAKYTDTDTQYTFVRDLPTDVYENIQTMSVRAAECMGLRDFCRVDWRLDKDNHPYFLEVNAIPGFTDHSLLPKAAGQAGFDMVKLCKTIVEMTLVRSKARSTT